MTRFCSGLSMLCNGEGARKGCAEGCLPMLHSDKISTILFPAPCRGITKALFSMLRDYCPILCPISLFSQILQNVVQYAMLYRSCAEAISSENLLTAGLYVSTRSDTGTVWQFGPLRARDKSCQLY